MRIIKRLKLKTHEKKITGLDMFYLVKRILRRNMGAYFKYIKKMSEAG